MPAATGRSAAGGRRLIHGIKHDGFRILAHRQGQAIRLMSRNGHDLGSRFPQIVEAMRSLPVQSCVIDGEAIVTDDKGLAVFDLIRAHKQHIGAELCAFDMLELDGEDLRRTRIEERKRTLARLLGRFQPGIVVNEYFEGDGAIHLQTRVHARLRGHRVQAARVALPRRPVGALAQDQEPARAGGAAT